MKEELLKGLTEEQIAKVKACKNTEEMLAVAKEEGVELSDEQLEAVSGGVCTEPVITCPKCGSTNCERYSVYGGARWHECHNCKFQWQVSIYSGETINTN